MNIEQAGQRQIFNPLECTHKQSDRRIHINLVIEQFFHALNSFPNINNLDKIWFYVIGTVIVVIKKIHKNKVDVTIIKNNFLQMAFPTLVFILTSCMTLKP